LSFPSFIILVHFAKLVRRDQSISPVVAANRAAFFQAEIFPYLEDGNRSQSFGRDFRPSDVVAFGELLGSDTFDAAKLVVPGVGGVLWC